jgi:large subunit ribosomal protein L17
MVTSLLEHERIQTTDAKAKEVRRVAERMITLGKRGTLHARRRAMRIIRRREVTAKVFDELADRYRDRHGGYTRILKLGIRTGDAAPVSIVELLQADDHAKTGSEPVDKKATGRKSARGKAPAKKAATAKKPAAKKDPAKKKTPAKKASAKKTGGKKSSVKKKASKGTAKKKTSRKKPD